MKRYLQLFFFIAFYSTAFIVFSQSPITTKANDGDDANVLLSFGRFLFPDFQKATFFGINGNGQAMMNYNLLTDEMMFVDAAGDTLVLSNPKDINIISFGKRNFKYTSKGYLEIVANEGEKALLVSRRIKTENVKQYGGYGIATGTSSIENINSLSSSTEKLNVSQEITYAVKNTFYLQSGKSILAATEKNFKKVFPKNKKTIDGYIEEQKLHLKRETDIINLFNYCAGEKVD